MLKNQHVRDRIGDKSCLAWFVFRKESTHFLKRVEEEDWEEQSEQKDEGCKMEEKVFYCLNYNID